MGEGEGEAVMGEGEGEAVTGEGEAATGEAEGEGDGDAVLKSVVEDAGVAAVLLLLGLQAKAGKRGRAGDGEGRPGGHALTCPPPTPPRPPSCALPCCVPLLAHSIRMPLTQSAG